MNSNTDQDLLSQLPIGYALFEYALDHHKNLSNFKLIEANEAFTQMSGLETHHFNSTDHVGDFHSALVEILKQSPVKDHVIELDTRFYKLHSRVDDSNRITLIMLDISAEKNEALDKTRIISALHDIVFEIDDNNTFTDVYAMDESKLFIPKDKLIGSKAGTLFRGEMAEKLSKARQVAKETLVTQYVDYPSIREDGRWFSAASRYSPNLRGGRYLVTIREITEEKLLREELETKDRQIERFFNVNTDLLSIVDSEGRFVKLSQSWEKMSGYTLDELIGRAFIDFVHPDDHDMTIAEASKIIDESSHNVFVNRYITKSKEIRHIEWSSQVDRGMYYSSARDITNRINLENQLKLQKEQYELAIKGTNEGIWDWNLETNYLFMSDRWREILGFEQDELENTIESFEKNLHPDDKPMVMSEIQQYLAHKNSKYDIEFRMVRKDGTTVWIHARGHAVFNSEGEPLRMLGSIRDITEERLLRQQLIDFNQRFLDISRFGRIFSWETDTKGLYTYVNEVVTDLLGYTPEEMINKLYFYDLHPKNNREEFKRKTLSEMSQHLTISNLLNPIETNQQKTVWVLTSANPLFNEQNELIGYRGFDIDITSLRNIEEQLKVSQERIEMLTSSMTDVLWLYNLSQKRFKYMSPSVHQLGFSEEESLERHLEDFMSEKFRPLVLHQISEVVDEFIINENQTRTYTSEYQLVHKDGRPLWFETSTRFSCNQNHEIEIVGVSRNVESRKQFENEILYLSYHDQLTGLYNRRYYEIEFNRLNTERNLPMSLIICDVNGLKLTNDAFGHIEGDKLLVQFAQILKSVSRADDIISRIGGDEFLILLPKSDLDIAKGIVERLTLAINESKPETIKLSVSFGISSTNKLLNADTDLFRDAENEMYRQKINIGNDYKNEIIQLITESLYAKFPDQERHSKRVSELCHKVAVAQNLSTLEINDARLAGLLHDIGKMGPTYSKASKDESENHPIAGYQILRSNPQLQHLSEYVLHHHEAMDGSGFPNGTKGSRIPMISRIIRIANDYDTLVNVQHLSKEEALEKMLHDSGFIYDADIMSVFQQIV